MASDFPLATQNTDNKKHSVTKLDNVIRANSESGHQISRARNTRRPRRLFTTGFTNIETTQRDLIEAFYDANVAQSFVYRVPFSGEEVSVTFQGPIEWTYVGTYPFIRWDSEEIQLREI